jgi:hypothetical protein
MKMTLVGIVTGVLLIGLALVGYFGGDSGSMTAFIPAIAGLPILIGSLIALNPAREALGMHIAAVFGLLGFLAPLGRIIPTLASGEFVANLAGISMIAMTVICGIFLGLCIKSFIDARRARKTTS